MRFFPSPDSRVISYHVLSKSQTFCNKDQQHTPSRKILSGIGFILCHHYYTSSIGKRMGRMDRDRISDVKDDNPPWCLPDSLSWCNEWKCKRDTASVTCSKQFPHYFIRNISLSNLSSPLSKLELESLSRMVFSVVQAMCYWEWAGRRRWWRYSSMKVISYFHHQLCGDSPIH